MFNHYKMINILLIILSTEMQALQCQMRNKILVKQNNECGLCNASFSKIIPHEIHHLNHNSSDNREYNLLALCCNCHAAHHRNNISVNPYLKKEFKFSKTIKPYC